MLRDLIAFPTWVLWCLGRPEEACSLHEWRESRSELSAEFDIMIWLAAAVPAIIGGARLLRWWLE